MKKRIAWFCAYSASDFLKSQSVFSSLYPKISAEYEIDLFLDNADLEDLRKNKIHTVAARNYHYLQAMQKHREQNYSCFFYQIEDRKECNFMRIHLALKPGIVWFHDFFLSNHNFSFPANIVDSKKQRHSFIFIFCIFCCNFC